MSSSANRFAAVVLGGIGLAYPFLVYAALGGVPAGALVLLVLAAIALRLVLARGSAVARPLIPAMAGVVVATGSLALADSRMAALAYPVLMSLGMAAAFGLSLRRGPSLIETFASLTEPNPDEAARAYMRKVTVVWSVFLLVNAALSALTALWGDLGLWTFYNGLVSYGLMGTLFAAEYWVRKRMRRA
jgi:uncharacterized membrane protein